ncbi:hypothetical protein BGZ76_010044, partial [Entomortierella beljakovae]
MTEPDFPGAVNSSSSNVCSTSNMYLISNAQQLKMNDLSASFQSEYEDSARSYHVIRSSKPIDPIENLLQSSHQTSQEMVLSSLDSPSPVDSSSKDLNRHACDVSEENVTLQELKGLLNQVLTLQNEANVKDDQMRKLQSDMLELMQEAKKKDDTILKLQLEAEKKSEMMITLQHQALDRLAILQKHAKSILLQNFELHEYTIPRLFIILPVDNTSWNLANILRIKFRLHFLCECGTYTTEENKEIRNQIHLARHEGYEIRNPTEFFIKYGKYMLILMKALKLGIQAVETTTPYKPIQSLVDAGIDYSIKYVENLSTDIHALKSDNSIDDYEALEGADLRQLGNFLLVNDGDRKLGNLFRMTTGAGHVRWVCIDHYRSTYQEKKQMAFANIVEVNGGQYDSEFGKATIKLKSRIMAEEFFTALCEAKHVYELDVTFDWGCSRTDLENLKDSLRRSGVSILRLDLQQFQENPARKILSSSTRYETLSHIIEHANMKVIHIVLSNDFIKLLSLQPESLSHLHKLSIEMSFKLIVEKEIQTLVSLLNSSTILTGLDLSHSSIGNKGASELSEVLKANTNLTTLNLADNDIWNEGASALSGGLKTNTALTTLNLDYNIIGNEGAMAL